MRLGLEKLRGRLKALFRENFEKLGELGAALSVWQNGKQVVDLYGGFCDADREKPWTTDTIVLVWSATKGIGSASLLHVLQQHKIELDRRVAEFWPEFAQAGKDKITLAQLLSHQAGLCALDQRVDMLDYDAVIRALETQTPLWRPGTAHGYHARTFGFLLDELVRRITGGTPLGTYFQKVFGEPLGLDLWIGIPDSVAPRVAPIFAPRKPRESGGAEDAFYAALSQPDSLTRKAFQTPAGLNSPFLMNDPSVRRHSLPSLGGIGTAESLARFYALLCSNQLFPSETVDRIGQLQCTGPDQVLRVDTAFGIGFMKDPVVNAGKTRGIFGSSLGAFGQPGSGGSLGFCDPENGVAFAYVMNQMEPGLFPNAKSLRIVNHLYDVCL